MAKLTWTDQQNLAQENTGLSDAMSLRIFKRDMQTGAQKFIKALGREYNRHSRQTDLNANQQFYQFPEDCHRLKEVVPNYGSYSPPLEQIPDEHTWLMMNMLPTFGLPTHYYIKGYKEVGFYPTPSQTVTSGLTLVFAPAHTTMTENDFITGTVTVTNGTNIITHSANGFTTKMANLGEWFSVTDGSDENWYQIAGYTNANTLTLENNYQGESGNLKSFRIGQVMEMPDEYLEAPADYATMRFYSKRGIIGLQQLQAFEGMFKTALQEAKDEYGQSADTQVVYAEPQTRIYNPFRGDPPASISA